MLNKLRSKSTEKKTKFFIIDEKFTFKYHVCNKAHQSKNITG